MDIYDENNHEEEVLPEAAGEDIIAETSEFTVSESEETVKPQPESAPGILEIVYGMFFSPSSTFATIARHPMVGKAILFFLFVQLLSTVNGIAVVREQLPDLLGSGFVTVFPVMILTMAMIGWFLNAAVLQLLAEFLGGKGRGATLFTALGFAYAPALFSAPVTVLLTNTYPKLLNLVTFVITVWVLVLTVLAIRTVHGFSTGKAVWTLFIPFLSFLILMIGFAIMTVLVIMGLGLEFPGMPGM